MKAHGTLTLSSERPLGTTASDGTFVLTLLAHDAFSRMQSTPWRLVWCGLNAKLFWSIHQDHLQAGALLEVTADCIWSAGNGRLGSSELRAQVTHARLLPYLPATDTTPFPGGRDQLLKTEQLQPV